RRRRLGRDRPRVDQRRRRGGFRRQREPARTRRERPRHGTLHPRQGRHVDRRGGCAGMTTLVVGTVTLNVAALSDPGQKRETNEDAYLAEGPAFVVADGMGGYEAGDRASAAVIEAFRARFAGVTVGEFAGVSDALLDADDRVAAVAGQTTRGAGSTATGV